MSLLDAVDRHRIGEALQRERVDDGGADLRLIHGEPGGGGEIDLVGWSDRLDAGREDDGIAYKRAFLVQHITERDHDAHGEPVVGLVRLGEPQLFLHSHRRQCRRGHTWKYEPEPVALWLDDAAVVSGRVTAQELAVLDEQRMQIRLGKRAEPHRRTADIGLHDGRRP